MTRSKSRRGQEWRGAADVRGFHAAMWARIRGGRKSNEVPGFTDSLRSLCEQGYCLTDISVMFGVSRERVRQWTKKFEINRIPVVKPVRLWDPGAGRFIALPVTVTAYQSSERKKRSAIERRQKLDSLQERFWSNVDVRDQEDCWLWAGKVIPQNGYGIFSTPPTLKLESSHNNGGNYAHRLAFLFHNGFITPGLSVCHECDVPLCVNPHHLWLGTQGDNVRDAIAKHGGKWGMQLRDAA